MILETDRLILRGFRSDDAPSLFKYAKDPRVGPMAGWLPHVDENYSKAVIRIILSKKESYAICLKGSKDEPVGSISFSTEGRSENPLLYREAELGYWVGVPFWGKGIATEAVKEMVRHGFEDLRLEKIYCGYFDGNLRSKKVQEKCGFIFHHINEKTKVLMLGETRKEYINFLTFSAWKGEITKKATKNI